MSTKSRQQRFENECRGRRGINKSKLRSPAQWRKWREAGALIPGFVWQVKGPGGTTMWLPTRPVSGKEMVEAMERCGKRPLTLQEAAGLLGSATEALTPDAIYAPPEEQADDRFRHVPLFRERALAFGDGSSWYDRGWEGDRFPTGLRF